MIANQMLSSILLKRGQDSLLLYDINQHFIISKQSLAFVSWLTSFNKNWYHSCSQDNVDVQVKSYGESCEVVSC